MEMNGRVFPNTDADTGIYSECIAVSRELPPVTYNESFTPSTGPTPHSPSSRSSRTQPLLSSLSLSTSIQQTAGSEREDAVDQPALNDYTVTTHQTVMNRTAAVASAYELPVTSVRQCIEGLQNNTMDNRVLTLPPRSAIRRSTVKQQSDFKQI